MVLVALGYMCFHHLPITRFPNVDVPIVSVRVTSRARRRRSSRRRSPSKIEDAIAGVAGVKHIPSTITDGQSTTAVEFWLEVNTDRALNDVKDAIADPRRPAARPSTSRIASRFEVEANRS